MAGIEKRVKLHPSERLDLIDMEGLINWANDRIAANSNKWLTSFSKLLDGFRVKYVDGLSLTFTSGSAIDGTGELIRNTTNIEKTISLVPNTTYQLGVRFRLVDSVSDSRAFWDQTVENDPGEPSGKEFGRNVPTRLSEEWEIVKDITLTSVEFNKNGITVPLIRVNTNGDSILDSNNQTLVLESYKTVTLSGSGQFIELQDSSLLPDRGYVNIAKVQAGSDIGSYYDIFQFNANDRSTNTLTITVSLSSGRIIPGLSVENSIATGDPVLEFLPSMNGTTIVDLRTYLFRAQKYSNLTDGDKSYVSADSTNIEFEDYLGRALIQDTPHHIQTGGGRAVTRTSPRSYEKRTDEHINDIYDELQILKQQFRELKFGQSASPGSDTVRADEWVDDLRSSTQAGASLRESIASYVTVGKGGVASTRPTTNSSISYGYFNVNDYSTTVECFADAMAALPDEGGILFIKPGEYTFLASLIVNKPVILQGQSQSSVVFKMDADATLEFSDGSEGSSVRDIAIEANTTSSSAKALILIHTSAIDINDCRIGQLKPDDPDDDWLERCCIYINPWVIGSPDRRDIHIYNCSLFNRGNIDGRVGEYVGPGYTTDIRNANVIIHSGYVKITHCKLYSYANYTKDGAAQKGELISDYGSLDLLISNCLLYGSRNGINTYSDRTKIVDCVSRGVSAIYDSGQGITIVDDSPDQIQLTGVTLDSSHLNKYLRGWNHYSYSWTGTVLEDIDTDETPFIIRIKAHNGSDTITNYEEISKPAGSASFGDLSNLVVGANTYWEIIDMPRGSVGTLLSSSTEDAGGSLIESCTFSGHSEWEIVTRQNNSTISNCYLDGSSLQSFVNSHIWADDDGSNLVSTNISNCVFDAIRYQGLSITATNGTRVQGCTFNVIQDPANEVNTVGPKLSTVFPVVGSLIHSSDFEFQNVDISECTFKGSYHNAIGCYGRNTTENYVLNLSISNNKFEATTINDSYAANYINLAMHKDITTAGSSTFVINNVSIVNNKFKCSDKVNSAIFVGETGLLDAVSSSKGRFMDFIIQSNSITPEDADFRPRFGILMIGAYQYYNFSITSNKIIRIERMGISTSYLAAGDASTNYIYDWIINDNNIYGVYGTTNNYAAGIFIGPSYDSSTNVSLVGNRIGHIGYTTNTIYFCYGIAMECRNSSNSSSIIISNNTIRGIAPSAVVPLTSSAYNEGVNYPSYGSYGILFVGSGYEDQKLSIDNNIIDRVLGKLGPVGAAGTELLNFSSKGLGNAAIAVRDTFSPRITNNDIERICGNGISVRWGSRWLGSAPTGIIINNNKILRACLYHMDEADLPNDPGGNTSPGNADEFVMAGIVLYSDVANPIGPRINNVAVSNNVISGYVADWRYGISRDLGDLDSVERINNIVRLDLASAAIAARMAGRCFTF